MFTRIVNIIAVVGFMCGATAAFAGAVSFSPSVTLPQSAHFSVALVVDPGGVPVLGAEVVAHFDPALVRLDGIDAGDWFTTHGTSGASYFFHDHTAATGAGEIHFSGALLGATSTAAGALAVCRFTILAPGLCPLDFVEVDVRGAGNSYLVFGHSENDRVSLSQGDLHFDPATTVAAEVDVTASLAISTGSYGVGHVEAVVGFDPTVIALTGIEPGPWVTGQGLPYGFVDHTTPGVTQAHLTLDFPGGAGSGDGIAAVCHFTALRAGVSPLAFTVVTVLDADGHPLPFAGAVGDRIVVDEAVPTGISTFGGIKASFR